jgi:hypothetical protein
VDALQELVAGGILTRYATGRRFEWKVRDELEANGYTVFRSAGSKGPADLIAFGDAEVLLVQCKGNGALPPKEWNALHELARLANPLADCILPILAQPIKQGKSVNVEYWELTDRKKGRSAPKVRFEPGVKQEDMKAWE